MSEWTRDRIVSVEVREDGSLGELRRLTPFVPTVRPIDLEVAPDGALYVLEFGSSFFGDNEDARLQRIEFSPDGTLPPVAAQSVSVRAGPAPLSVTFSAEGSLALAEGASSASYEWDTDGDGAMDGAGATFEATYDTGGVYQPTLTVVDSDGRRSIPVAARIVVGNTPPSVVIDSPAAGLRVTDGTTVPLAYTIVDAEDGTPACEDVSWDIRLGHNAHAHPYELLDGCATEFVASLGPGVDPAQHFFAIELVYRDRGGAGGEPSLVGRAGTTVGIEAE